MTVAAPLKLLTQKKKRKFSKKRRIKERVLKKLRNQIQAPILLVLVQIQEGKVKLLKDDIFQPKKKEKIILLKISLSIYAINAVLFGTQLQRKNIIQDEKEKLKRERSIKGDILHQVQVQAQIIDLRH